MRRGCSLSPTLFRVFINDLEKMIYGFKFADDVAMVADTAEGLQKMLEDLERYPKENGMEVNTKNTKVIVCRNDGKLRKEDIWK